MVLAQRTAPLHETIFRRLRSICSPGKLARLSQPRVTRARSTLRQLGFSCQSPSSQDVINSEGRRGFKVLAAGRRGQGFRERYHIGHCEWLFRCNLSLRIKRGLPRSVHRSDIPPLRWMAGAPSRLLEALECFL
jgi:hypothetical protein